MQFNEVVEDPDRIVSPMRRLPDGTFPPEGDVHVRIWLADVVLDYASAAMAVPNLIHDWRKKRWCTIELMRDTIDNCRLLPRLPYERLFLGP
ncbi:hypothetical protein ACFXG4_12130 [Nocardia sp. NPDC059246]|uniref:hypothetical protein n=1 Tax=unclassified Nocardia TaxID=2637762 RepID=UPI0036BE3C80